MKPLGAALLLLLCFVAFCAPRRWALLGIMGGVLYLTQSVQIQLGGINLFAIRFLELIGFIRVISRGEFSFSKLNPIDRILIVLYSYVTVVYLLRANEGIAYQLGVAIDAILCYFMFRGLVRDKEDFHWFLRSFLFLLAPYVILLLVERFTRQNPFSIVGANGSEWIREGKVRCFGSFRHPSLLGTLGASFLPCYIALFPTRQDRKSSVIGILLCLAIVVASNSGGPLNAAAIACLSWACWRYRTRMRLVRRGLCALILLLALMMKAPVWYLIAKVSSLTGGDGWHRSYLLDMTAQHFQLWWVAGIPIKDTSDWFPYNISGTGGSDITNQFVSFGITAGLAAIVLFVILLVRSYKMLGQAMQIVRQSSVSTDSMEYVLWGLGAVLTTHISNWFGITYFDQTYAIWFMQLAVISRLAENCLVLKYSRTEPRHFSNECEPKANTSAFSFVKDN